ncbi:MAG: VWA domain-containing protein [Paraclostridium sp.]
MGFFKKLFGGKKETSTNVNENVKTSNIGENNVISLKKNDEKITISLSKKNVKSLTAEVKLVLDRSGSMSHLYRDGTVQRTLEKLASLAFRFDDNGKMETILFNHDFVDMPDVTMENLFTYGDENGFRNIADGGTNYAPPIMELIDQAKMGMFTFPVFVIFITDGENFDKTETMNALREASKYDIYFQFVGIGGSRFDFLESLDNLKGRNFDNAGFIAIPNLNKISDEDLYDKLLDEFVDNCKNNVIKGSGVQLIDLSK